MSWLSQLFNPKPPAPDPQILQLQAQATKYASQQADALNKAAETQALALAEQRKAEEARRQQMHLTAVRLKRDLIRDYLARRNRDENLAVASGVQFGSIMEGAAGTSSGRTGVAQSGILANERFGESIFQANERAGQFFEQEALLKGQAAAFGAKSSMKFTQAQLAVDQQRYAATYKQQSQQFAINTVFKVAGLFF